MEEKTIGQLAEEVKELVRHFEKLCAMSLAHPVFPYMPGAAEQEQRFVICEESLRDGLNKSIASITPVIEQIEASLANMEKYRDQIPEGGLSN